MSEDLPKAAAAVVTAGRSHGLELDVREFPEGTRTAADAARAIGCQVDQIVKSLVFMADTDPVLVLTSGGNRVDVVKVGRQRDAATVRKADAEEVRAANGYGIRGTPAVRPPPPPPRAGVRAAPAAAPPHVFPTAPGALLRATGGQVADVTLAEEDPPTG